MEKLKKRLTALFIVIILLSIAIVCLVSREKQNAKNVTYNIDVTVSENRLDGEVNLYYVNNENFEINELYFCLYPNAFKKEENLINTTVSDKIHEAYPTGFDGGYINVNDVFIDNEKVDFFLESDEQILKINTPVLKNGEDINIKIAFDEKLPNSPSRFGYSDNTYNFGNWYPVLCPYVNGTPYKCLYTANGDPFFSECADYNVTIKASPEYRIATSGKILKQENIDPLTVKWTIQGKNLRDFAFVISENYNLQSEKIDETLVYSYYLNDDELGQFSLNVAKNALKVFNELFGKYPYETLSVAETDFYIGGMEYPNVVFINTALYNESAKDALEEVIVHEIAHQWWYGVIGNNEIEEAWLDEGLTQYSVALYYEYTYGKERYLSFLNESEIYCKVVFEVLNNADLKFSKKIDRKSNEFEHWILYDALAYDVSALMFDELRNTIGDETFFNGIKQYYDENKFKIVDKKSLIKAYNTATQKNIEGIINPWLEGKIYWG